ncbi:hypothetical protein [Bacillus smithii]|uniref:hypothetical protein n=1 Tax=Bacillus smithii TaxID=1479 RepID=UPI003D22AE13
MKFTKPNKDGILCNKFFDTYTEAKKHYKSGIIAVVGLEEWGKLPNGYKGFVNGKPHVLYMTDQGTTYGECNIVYSI